MKILIVYDSKTGNTEKMAFAIAEGIKMGKVNVEVKKVEETKVESLLYVQGLVIGSPVYYGLPSAKLKSFIDSSVKFHGKLDGLIGGAFASSGGNHSGAETTIMAIIEALLIHGMIVQGTSGRNHYGPVSKGSPDDNTIETCKKYGEKIAHLVTKFCG